MNPKRTWALFAIVVSLASCASPGAATSATESGPSMELFEKLLGELHQVTASPQRPSGVSDQVGVSLRQAVKTPNYPSAENTLGNLRRLHGANPSAVAIVDRLSEFLQAREAADLKAADAALTVIKEEFRGKVAARAPAKAFDALLERLALVEQSRAHEIYSANFANRRIGAVTSIRGVLIRWQEFLIQRDAGEFDLAANSLEGVASSMFDPLQMVHRSEFILIQRELLGRLKTTREVKIARLRAKVEELKKKLPSIIDRAGTAADLDAVLGELPAMRPGNDAHFGNYPPSHHELNGLIENLQRFVRNWQDYLSQLAAQNTTAAQLILGSISRDGTFETFYPRSRVLERINMKQGS